MRRTFAWICVLLFAVVTTALVPFAVAQQTMDNAAILKLQKAGLSEDLIVSTVNGQPGTYSLTTDDLIALKKAGVTDKVIAAMLAKNSAPAATTPAAPVASDKPPVDEVGVYYMTKEGKWTPIMPEIVNFKTGGVLKSMATVGVVKGDVNGHLKDSGSKLDVHTPLKLLIFTPEGTAPTEYQLLRLRVNGNSREFRSVTGGVYHVSSGATRDQVEFTYTKIAPRCYEVDLTASIGTGQYGVLPPNGLSSANAASSGKLYSFHVIE